MGECKYCNWNSEISYGRFQCSRCEPESDFCLAHKDLHIELHPSHKQYITDKQSLLEKEIPENPKTDIIVPKRKIFGSVQE